MQAPVSTTDRTGVAGVGIAQAHKRGVTNLVSKGDEAVANDAILDSIRMDGIHEKLHATTSQATPANSTRTHLKVSETNYKNSTTKKFKNSKDQFDQSKIEKIRQSIFSIYPMDREKSYVVVLVVICVIIACMLLIRSINKNRLKSKRLREGLTAESEARRYQQQRLMRLTTFDQPSQITNMQGLTAVHVPSNESSVESRNARVPDGTRYKARSRRPRHNKRNVRDYDHLSGYSDDEQRDFDVCAGYRAVYSNKKVIADWDGKEAKRRGGQMAIRYKVLGRPDTPTPL